MRRLNIAHTTTYDYSAPVAFGPHKMLLRPRVGHDIRIESSKLEVSPNAARLFWHRDAQGNSVAIATFAGLGDHLSISSEVVVEHYEDDQTLVELDIDAITYPFQYDAMERAELFPYMQPVFTQADEEVRAWVKSFWVGGQSPQTFELIDRINKTVHSQISYNVREEFGVQRPFDTLCSGTGSCRDLATLFLEGCRHLGFAARFVSGYLYAPDLPDAAASTHAWAEVYLPGAGWCGFDPTTGNRVGSDHIAVAVARHPETVPPVAGSFSGSAQSTLQVDVKLIALDS